MARRNGHGSIQKKSVKTKNYPTVYVDAESDFASIKLAPGTETKSFLRDGFIFCENKDGEIIEIQVLNLSRFARRRRPPRAA